MRVLSPAHRAACAPAVHPSPLTTALPAPPVALRAALPAKLFLGLRPISHALADANAHHVAAPASQPPRSTILARGLARQILAQPGIEGDPPAFLDVSEAYWRALRNQKHEPHKKGPTVVSYADGPLPPPTLAAAPAPAHAGAPAPLQPQQGRQRHDFDVVICGGTLGLFLATALQLRGWRVAIVEKRLVQGRNQEWNISWGELEVLQELGLLSREELREAVVSEFNPIRVGFLGGEDMWTRDVLNLGVHPRRLLEALRRRFAAAGGVVYENTAFRSAAIHTDGLRLKLSPGGSASPLAVGDTNRPNGLGSPTSPVAASSSASPASAPRSLTCRLLLDCMGHYSDIVKQIRGRVKPDGMCMVVGSCAEGFPADRNVSADLLYSLSHSRGDMQLFWEAFPAEGGAGRTTYMFAYSDAHPERPTFEQLLDTYFEMLPQYQGLPLDQLRFKRVLFGGFPCYSNGPLQPAFDRVMQIGDASAAQSPLSFGGFGSMMRHLGRLTRGLNQALAEDRLARGDLSWLQPYQPSLSASWLFQRSMSFGVGQVAYPPTYPHAPPYYTAAAVEKAAASAAAADAADAEASAAAAAMVMGAGAGPAAAFQEGVAMAAARFAAGAADPADYFHQEGEEEDRQGMVSGQSPPAPPTAAAAAAATAAAAAPPPPPAPAAKAAEAAKAAPLFERDFRSSPEWLRLPYSHVNEILGCNFGVMGVLGDRVLRPFLQDTIQLGPLSLSMAGMMIANPVTVSRVLLQVGPRTLLSWFAHYTALLAYTLAYAVLRPLRQVVPYYGFQRLLDALEYGSGSDYRYHHAPPAAAAAAAAAPMQVAEPAAAGEVRHVEQVEWKPEEATAAVEQVGGADGEAAAAAAAERVPVAAASAAPTAAPTAAGAAAMVGPNRRG
ncbi:hypothetical protein PLESTB_000665700 [Pleodorina starrii]|uniref:Uncharacterized protein n=1 Tax=Pleodorina starrii TaxID=330485 RepID=A0A9W6BJ84_9CHLO|nr:hypothetical protein PLESTB_000665700 [Pleodorina starrii]GLC65890.1 hypothetical protein PLESTF_000354900 [Pleodorina starrii]